MTADLISLIRVRDKLKFEVDNYDKCDAEGRLAKFKEFKKHRNLVKRNIIVAKREFTKGKLQINEDNPRKYWAELNRVFPTSKTKKDESNDVIHLVNEQDEIIEPDKTSEYINEFFTNIGPTLANKITTDNKSYIDSLTTNPSNRTLSTWSEITPSEVNNLGSVS